MMKKKLLNKVNNDIKTALIVKNIFENVHLLIKNCMTIFERFNIIFKPRAAVDANVSAFNVNKQTNSFDNKKQSSIISVFVADNKRSFIERYAIEKYNFDKKNNFCYRCHRSKHKISNCSKQI